METHEEKLLSRIRDLELELVKYKELVEIAFTLGEWTNEYKYAYEQFKKLNGKKCRRFE